MDTKETRSLAIMVETERTSMSGDRPWLKLRARPVYLNARHDVEMPSAYGTDDREHGLHRLEISAQNTPDHIEAPAYWNRGAEYRDVYSVDARGAETMHKTLSGLQRKLDKLDAKYGYVTTFGQHVARFADAVGATTFVIRTRGKVNPSTGTEYRICDATGAAYMCDLWEREYANEIRPSTTEQSA